MTYISCNGVIKIPTIEEARKDYKNKYREEIIHNIEKANIKLYKGFVMDRELEEWIKEELEIAGYKVVLIPRKFPINGESMKYTEISWE